MLWLKSLVMVFAMLPCLAYSTAYAVVNVNDNSIVQGSVDNQEVSIASISKLMTIYTVLQSNPDLTELLEVTGKKTPNTKLSRGMVVSRVELINMALISSDNLAAITLAENYPGGYSRFMSDMNNHARSLNMLNSGFVEPTGLSPMNYSTVSDLILLTKAVYGFDIIRNAAQTATYVSHAITKTKKGKKKLQINNNGTIKYFGKDGIVTIKTGFTTAAGYCITMLINTNNTVYNVIVLGAKTKIERQRIIDTALKSIQ